MTFLKKYITIWIQCIAFSLLAILKHEYLFFIPVAILFILPFALPEAAKKYISYLEIILNKIGYQIKNILFFLLYFTVFAIIAFIKNLTQKKEMSGYVVRNKEFTATDFNKMW